MNPRELESAPLILPEDIARARSRAQASGKRAVEMLEEPSGLPPEALRCSAGGHARLRRGARWPSWTASSRPSTCCPIRRRWRTAACCCARRTASWCSRSAIRSTRRCGRGPRSASPAPSNGVWRTRRMSSAYLARYGETMRAMDSVLTEAAREEGGRSRLEELSLKSHQRRREARWCGWCTPRCTTRSRAGASDIHLETTATQLVIKYRLDGVLSMMGTAQGLDMAEQVISRIKVMAELDIAERRMPQDGRFKVLAQGREIDFRVSIMPSIFGEDAVLRILDKQSLTDHVKGLESLDALGFDAHAAAMLRRLSSEPYGMLLVTGPHRQRQDHHAVRRDLRDQPRLRQDHHHRGPGRVPAPRRAADPGEREEGPHLRARAALDPAPRPGQDHGGRDPRPRDRADRGAGRAHRASRVHHRARQQRVRRDRPLHAHGRGPVQLRLGAQRHRRAAAGARELHPLRARRGAGRAAAGRVGPHRRAGAGLATCARGAAAATAAAPASAAARRSPRSWCSTTRSAS